MIMVKMGVRDAHGQMGDLNSRSKHQNEQFCLQYREGKPPFRLRKFGLRGDAVSDRPLFPNILLAKLNARRMVELSLVQEGGEGGSDMGGEREWW
jgi:hypothetical protein